MQERTRLIGSVDIFVPSRHFADPPQRGTARVVDSADDARRRSMVLRAVDDQCRCSGIRKIAKRRSAQVLERFVCLAMHVPRRRRVRRVDDVFIHSYVRPDRR